MKSNVTPPSPFRPAVSPRLDPDFQPLALWARACSRAGPHDAGRTLAIAVEREQGRISRFDTCLPPDWPDALAARYAERLVKFMLWSRGGWRVYVAGPDTLTAQLAVHYTPNGARGFDVDIMQRIYEQTFAFEVVAPEDIPDPSGTSVKLGGHLEGCRIGFDLGASDFKLAAVKDGEPVFSTEIPWDPKNQADPDYHYRLIQDGLKQAAAHLPRVDAIGGSSAGVVVNNRIMVASLFRSVPPERFDEARTIFLRLQKEWQVPLEVINDGEVTALAGALSLGKTGMLGMAMGSSEAVGFLTPDGLLPGWLDELAFAPVDFNPAAPPDEWSGDRGVGALYFSQQAVNKLAPAAGITFAPDLPLPERLNVVQDRMAAGDEQAAAIYETIGTYLGYTLPWYAQFYPLQHVLVLGRVLSGPGGTLLLDTAQTVLRKEFPEWVDRISVNLPDEQSRRVGQAVAAASLPALA